jgi:hypothetical protein
VGDRLNRRLAKWDAANQATMRKQNEMAGGTWEEFTERNFPGPSWAYAMCNLPVVGLIGAIVIHRARRSRRNAAPDDQGRIADS